MDNRNEQNAADQPTGGFSINGWFNNLPIRIVGSTAEPFFYANDIADILGIKNVRNSVRKFDHTQIVSDDRRQELGLETYKIHRGHLAKDDKIILLTEIGAYKLIMKSKARLAKDFQTYVFGLIKEAREKEKTELQVLKTEKAELQAQLLIQEKKMSELKKYEENCPTLVVFRRKINDNPYKHISPEDIDDDFKEDVANFALDDEQVEYLYKYTINPTADDYIKFGKPYAEMYGSTKSYISTFHRSIFEIGQKAISYCFYSDDDYTTECDELCLQVVYMDA